MAPLARRLGVLAALLFAATPIPLLLVFFVSSDVTIVELTPPLILVRGMIAAAAVFALGAVVLISAGRGGSRPYRRSDAFFATVAVAAALVLGYWWLLPL